MICTCDVNWLYLCWIIKKINGMKRRFPFFRNTNDLWKVSLEELHILFTGYVYFEFGPKWFQIQQKNSYKFNKDSKHQKPRKEETSRLSCASWRKFRLFINNWIFSFRQSFIKIALDKLNISNIDSEFLALSIPSYFTDFWSSLMIFNFQYQFIPDILLLLLTLIH